MRGTEPSSEGFADGDHRGIPRCPNCNARHWSVVLGVAKCDACGIASHRTIPQGLAERLRSSQADNDDGGYANIRSDY